MLRLERTAWLWLLLLATVLFAPATHATPGRPGADPRAAAGLDWTITASADAGGAITPSGAVAVADGGTQPFSILADPCHTILDVLVDGASVGAVSSYQFDDVDADHTIHASFSLNTHTITASAGAGGSIDPSGAVVVACGANQGFTITADPCYTIADVLVDGVSVGAVASHTFTDVQEAHTISATFTLGTFTIAASAGTGGVIDPSGATIVECGADQTFTITADACYTIADVLVDGVSVGAVASHTFTNVQAAHTIHATFTLVTFTITASAGAGGAIDPSGATVVNCGANQTFTITADPCFAIADVLVDGVSVGAVASHTFTNVQAAHTISATFTLDNFTITASAGTGGVIDPSGATIVECGADQTFNITADPCYTIADVLVDGVSVGAVASHTFTNVQAAHTIHATFTLGTFTITASAGAGGAIDPSGATVVNCGANQTFTITADPCFAIADVLVDGVSVGAVASHTFTNVQATHTIHATFVATSYTITASAGAGGAIDPSGAVVVACGANQGFTITADPCYSIADVLVDGVSVGAVASHTFTNVQAAHTISATFTLDNFTITASAGTGGVIDPSGATIVECGADQTFNITADPCYTIADVLVDGVSVGAVASHTFTNVQAAHTIHATFTLGTFTITASAGAGGAIDPSGATVVNCGANQTFTITADPCFAIADVLVDGVSVGAVASHTFTNVQATHTIHATFVATSYTITASAGAGGAIDPSGAVVVACGANQGFTITADPCYSIADVLVDGVSVGAVASHTFTNVQAAHTIHATFTLVTYTITASAGAGGAIDPSGATVVNCGANQGFTITADPCYTIADVLVDGVSVGAVASHTFTNVQAAHTIHATFTLVTYTLTASAGPNGSIVPVGAVVVGCGANQSFSITPHGGFIVQDVLVDGVSQGRITSYTFTNVTADHTISATFEVNAFTLSLGTSGSGTASKSPDQPTYIFGAAVTLTATPTAGSHFAGWTGDASGFTNPLGITMDGNKSITATFLPNVYTWNQTGTASWQTSTNWTPQRQIPSTTDVIVFSAGGAVAVTDVPSQSIAQLVLQNGSSVTLQAAVTGSVLTLRGAAGNDLDVSTGCTLAISGANALSIGIGTSTLAANGLVAGTVLFTGGAHKFVIGSLAGNNLSYAAGGVCVGGAGFTGSMYGTVPLNSVTFQAGSVYSHVSGGNPFGATAPNSVVVFQTGSKYRIDAPGITPSMAGRTYANFELNAAGTASGSGASLVTIDSLTITLGTLSLNTLTGGIRVRGDLTVQVGAGLNFAPASVQTVSFTGNVLQTLTRNGTITTNANSNYEINNPAGVQLATSLTHAGTLQFTSGKLFTGVNTLTLSAAGTVTGASPVTGWIAGILKRTLTPVGGEVTRSFEIGDFSAYTPVTVAMHTLAATFELTARTTAGDHPNLGTANVSVVRSLNRYWTLTPATPPAFSTFDATFAYAAADVDAGADPLTFIVKRWNGSAWFATTIGTRTATSTQATGLTGFNDFAIAEPNQNTLNLTVVGNGTVTRIPDQPRYVSGSTVQLSATPAPGWTFIGWTGDVTGSASPINVVMNADKNVTATFADITPPSVTVSFPNGGETLGIGGVATLAWTATDVGGVTAVDLYVSRDGAGGTYQTVVLGVPNTGTFDWLVTGPGTNPGPAPVFTAFLKVVARDVGANAGTDVSNTGFAIYQSQPGAVGDERVTEFALTAVGPNPTRGSVQMSFGVPEESAVRLSVVDVQGREVALISDGARRAGRHTETWSGRTADGDPMPVGVYFVRMQAGGKNMVKRVVFAH